MLDKFISSYRLQDIRKIEEIEDTQFLVLKKAFEKVNNKSLFVFLVVQNALLSYQLSNTWENRWKEFAEYVVKNQNSLNKDNLLDWWKEFLLSCKWNRRLLNMKIKRLEKTLILYDDFLSTSNIEYYYNNMLELNQLLANKMKQKNNAKTIVFAVKMYGYVSRIMLDKFIPYPMNIAIPIDSRITKIYEMETRKEKFTNKQIEEYFMKLSYKYKIPPLHLDSLLWVKFWKDRKV